MSIEDDLDILGRVVDGERPTEPFYALTNIEAELTRLTIENEDLKREIKKNQAAASDKEERGESARTYLEQHERFENARLREALEVVRQTFEDEYGPASDEGMGPPWSDPIFNALKETDPGRPVPMDVVTAREARRYDALKETDD